MNWLAAQKFALQLPKQLDINVSSKILSTSMKHKCIVNVLSPRVKCRLKRNLFIQDLNRWFSESRSCRPWNGQFFEGADGDRICQNRKIKTSWLKTQVVHVLLFISFLLSGLFINGIQLLLFLVVVRWLRIDWNKKMGITDFRRSQSIFQLWKIKSKYSVSVIEAC